jgi:hypothetical protein
VIRQEQIVKPGFPQDETMPLNGYKPGAVGLFARMGEVKYNVVLKSI